MNKISNLIGGAFHSIGNMFGSQPTSNQTYFSAEPKSAPNPAMRNVPPPVKRWWDVIGMGSSFRPNETLDQYGNNVWIYGAINIIAQELSRTKFYLQKEDQNGDIEIIRKHQAIETLNLPLRKRDGRAHLTRMSLMMLTGQHLLLNGEAFWVMDNRLGVTGSPTSLFPLIPSSVKTELGSDNLIEKYVYQTSERQIVYDAEDVVHFRLPNPGDFYRGHSPVKSAWSALETHRKADDLNYYRFENMAIPAGLLTSDKAIPEKERKKLLAEFLALFQGEKNTEKTGILPWGLDFKKISETNKDMQFKEGKETNRDEILANWRVGMEMLGKTESQTRANADASNYVFQRFNILPLVESIADTLTYDYAPAFAGTEGLTFAFEDPVPENVEEKRETTRARVESGITSIDEERKMWGLEPLDIKGWSDVPLVQLSKMPLGEGGIPPNEPLPNEDEEE